MHEWPMSDISRRSNFLWKLFGENTCFRTSASHLQNLWLTAFSWTIAVSPLLEIMLPQVWKVIIEIRLPQYCNAIVYQCSVRSIAGSMSPCLIPMWKHDSSERVCWLVVYFHHPMQLKNVWEDIFPHKYYHNYEKTG